MGRKERNMTNDSNIENNLDDLDQEDILDEEDGELEAQMMTKRDAFIAKWKARAVRNKHRGIERKTKGFIVAIAVLVSGGGYSIYHNHSVQVATSKQATPFGFELTFSLSGSKVTTGTPIRSTDNSTVYIPVAFNDISSLSTDANNYWVILGSPEGHFTYQPQGQLLIFGDTGKGAVVLQGQPQIANEMITVYIRNDKNLTGAQEKNVKTSGFGSVTGIEAAKAQYDLVDFNVNPGATNIKAVDNLDSTTLDANKLYQSLFSNAEVDEIHQKLLEDQEQIELAKKKIEEYRNRLVRSGYTVPDDPIYMKDNWRSAASRNVKLSNNLDEGFENTGGLEAIVAKVDKLKKEREEELKEQTSSSNSEETFEQDSKLTSKTVANNSLNQIEIKDEELFELDKVQLKDALIRDDGTLSSDEINTEVSGTSAQSTWQSMCELYEETLKIKQNMFTQYADELLSIERETKRQQKSASLSDGSRFTLLDPVGEE